MMERGSALILEDEPIVAFALEDMLIELGFEPISVATTIEEALRHLDDFTPSAAVLDVNIRGSRSYGVAQARRLSTIRHPPGIEGLVRMFESQLTALSRLSAIKLMNKDRFWGPLLSACMAT